MSTTISGHTLGRVLVDELARAGLTDVCLSPGSRSAPLALAFAADPRIAVHVVLDERSAAFAALGIGKGSGRPAAVLCTSGTAAANLHPAVIEARESRTPLIVLTADRPPELRDAGANQTTDQVKLFGSAVRWFCEVGVPEARPGSVAYWRSVAARASAEARGSPAGAVHLNLAFREPLVADPGDGGCPFPLEGRAENRPWTEVRLGGRSPAESDVKWLTELAEQTEKGIVIAGAGVIEPGPVLELAHNAGWPVIAEPVSGLRLDEHAISTYDALLRVEGFARSHRPDLVIRIGRLGLSRALDAFLEPEIRQVMIDRDAAWLDPERVVSHVLAVDPASICGRVAKSLSGRGGSEWLGSWQGAERTARAVIDELLDAEDAPSEPRAARDLAAGLTDGSSLIVAPSMPVRDLDWFMAARRGLRVVANRGVNGIDGVVSTAVGVALAVAGPTAALVGDLALIHDQIGLQLARAEHVDLVVVVINNDGGGIFSFLPYADHPEHFEHLFGTPHGLDLGTLASLYRCGYVRIERADDLIPAVIAAQREGGPHVVEVRTERASNVALHRDLWAAVARAIG